MNIMLQLMLIFSTLCYCQELYRITASCNILLILLAINMDLFHQWVLINITDLADPVFILKSNWIKTKMETKNDSLHLCQSKWGDNESSVLTTCESQILTSSKGHHQAQRVKVPVLGDLPPHCLACKHINEVLNWTA